MLRGAPVRLSLCPRMRRYSSAYDATRNNLKINANTRVIYQGFTGRLASSNCVAARQWGTNIVGGVTPGKSGEHLELPLFSTVKEAVKELKPDATAVFVAAPYAASAIEEAIENEIPLVVAVAEHVPVHDMLRVHSILATQSKTRLVGANSPGIINPEGHCLVGFLPHPSFLPGSIGIVSKSGTLGYEAVASTTRAGLGQSLVVGMGGDWLAGTTLTDAIRVFLEDERTEGIIVIGEIGGNVELEVAELLKSWKGKKKPVMGLIAGVIELEGKVMGHAGALRMYEEVDAGTKVRALREAGVHMVRHPGQFGERMSGLLGRKLPDQPVKGMGPGPFKRGLHTLARRKTAGLPLVGAQKRMVHVRGQPAADMLLKACPELQLSSAANDPKEPTFTLALTIDRQAKQPTFMASPSPCSPLTSFPFTYLFGPSPDLASRLASFLSTTAITPLITPLWKAFVTLKPYTIHLPSIPRSTLIPPASTVALFLDPALSPSPGGTVFYPLPMWDKNPRIATLVNGAGLAMNTCDTLYSYGGSPANFLDTGGKATAQDIRKAFDRITQDPSVRVVLVNIFGGLTDCGIMAEGLMTALRECDIKLKTVVRLRGYREESGQGAIRRAGLKDVEVVEDFEEAARRAVELVKEAREKSIDVDGVPGLIASGVKLILRGAL